MLAFYVRYISQEWKYCRKTKEVVSKDYQTWIGRKNENSRLEIY